MAPRVSKRAVQPPLPFFQRPNVQRALIYSVITIGGGYIISRTMVISDHEQEEVLVKYRHAGKRRAEQNRKKKEEEEEILTVEESRDQVGGQPAVRHYSTLRGESGRTAKKICCG